MTTFTSTSDERTANNVMRHEYRVLSDAEKAQMQAIKDKGLELHNLIDSVGLSRELSIAKTKTEEAVMWAVKHIKSSREVELEELLRSACAIAERRGDGTNWDRFIASVHKLGLNGVTARTYRLLPSDVCENPAGKP